MPIYNSRDDFRGYMPLLFITPSLWANADWEELGIMRSENVFDLEDDHPAKYLCCTVEGIERYILRGDLPAAVFGERLRDILLQVMIRGTLTSHIPFDTPSCIGGDIPPIQKNVINITYSETEVMGNLGAYSTHLQQLGNKS
jgi:hypothetical protein